MTVGDKRVARKKIIAEHVAEAIATGRVTLPDKDETVLELSPRDWMEFTKWLYTHIDGAAKQEIEHTGDVIHTIKTVKGVSMDNI
jgi:uncharacterized membrane protein YcgQ (UPF0703/DUF1980 family)